MGDWRFVYLAAASGKPKNFSALWVVAAATAASGEVDDFLPWWYADAVGDGERIDVRVLAT